MGSFSSVLISYVVQSVREQEGTLGKTKLVKLLYLIDVEYYRRFHKTLTDWQWYFYHYGPYAFEIETILDSMPLDFDEEEFTTRTGHRAKSYRSLACPEDFESSFDYSQKVIIDRVVQKWALDDLNTVLDYVYFETEPMEDAQRGERLDFSRILPEQRSFQLSPQATIPPKRLAALKKSFKELMATKKRASRLKLTPPPPYDDVYYEALNTMNEDESR